MTDNTTPDTGEQLPPSTHDPVTGEKLLTERQYRIIADMGARWRLEYAYGYLRSMAQSVQRDGVGVGILQEAVADLDAVYEHFRGPRC